MNFDRKDCILQVLVGCYIKLNYKTVLFSSI